MLNHAIAKNSNNFFSADMLELLLSSKLLFALIFIDYFIYSKFLMMDSGCKITSAAAIC